LGTDRIDLYQLHFPDPRFPIEETLGALSDRMFAGCHRRSVMRLVRSFHAAAVS
jgi:aryl-alcohol dehydrogenase-like predicted oxidoreductase